MGTGNYELDMDLYFWMIDRATLPDDTRNIVRIEENRVNLHRDHGQRLDNAVYIATLMTNMRKIVIKKSKKSFPLDS